MVAKPRKLRLDELVVARGLAESRAKAQALILAGRVLVDDRPADKPGTRVAEEALLRVRGEARRYASRGGEKLAGALADLGVPVSGRRCLDVGASTGGFTDCLLQHGATHVIALDVGYGQLDVRLRGDPRVTVVERVNAREMDAEHVPTEPAVDLVVVDVSFISATLVLPRIAAVAPHADVLVMVKPQFEVGRGRVRYLVDASLGAVRTRRLSPCPSSRSPSPPRRRSSACWTPRARPRPTRCG